MRAEELAFQCVLLRDLFGNPFLTKTLEASCRNVPVIKLSKNIYEQRAFADLSRLGSALEDAGCNSAEVLEHCCGLGPHTRGCWVVDLVLGKE